MKDKTGKKAPFGFAFRVFAFSAALTLAFASSAFADTVTNLLDNSPAATQFEEVRVNEGETRGVPFRVLAGSEKYPPADDGEGGCNIDSGEVLDLGFNSTNDSIARENPAGSRIVFQDGADSGTVASVPTRTSAPTPRPAPPTTGPSPSRASPGARPTSPSHSRRCATPPAGAPTPTGPPRSR